MCPLSLITLLCLPRGHGRGQIFTPYRKLPNTQAKFIRDRHGLNLEVLNIHRLYNDKGSHRTETPVSFKLQHWQAVILTTSFKPRSYGRVRVRSDPRDLCSYRNNHNKIALGS